MNSQHPSPKDRSHQGHPSSPRRLLSRDDRSQRTDRLLLDVPTMEDIEPLHEIYADPRVWTHFPSLRHTEPSTTGAMLGRWITAWESDGLGPWMVREAESRTFLGHAGCRLLGAPAAGAFWNLGYRFAPEAHGHGYATEVSRAALEAARAHRPEIPVVAYLLEHNTASRRVAENVGLTLRHRAPDAGNPDPDAIRLVLADRELTAAQLAETLR
ncbi:GNAT family N-acetyltransferase [Brachybacterium sp. GCM10030267]|uniref:GNAT family N-acetyltransferase n=1 Tax=unclassified Brachybacterium TaxID=2623841 RepID=UPI003607A2D5